MNILTESVVRYQCGQWTIRVWREEPSGDLNEDSYLRSVIKKLRKVDLPRQEIAARLLSIEGINRVEVLDCWRDEGIVIYKKLP